MPGNLQNETATGGFKIKDIQSLLKNAESHVVEKLKKIREKNHDEINLGDMFDMQWMMNRFAQMSEMASSVLSASHQVIASLNRNLKG